MLTRLHRTWTVAVALAFVAALILAPSSLPASAQGGEPYRPEPLLILRHEGLIFGATWSDDGSRILAWDEGIVHIWDVKTGHKPLTLRLESWVRGARWNKDESLILTWGRWGHIIRVWSANTGEVLLRLDHKGGRNDYVNGAAWSTNEDRILTWSDDGTARIWDANTGDELVTLCHDSSVRGATWNADSARILTWSADRTVKVWDAKNGAELYKLLHNYSVWGAIWNSDESRILSWAGDGMVVMWDSRDGSKLLTLQEHYGHGIESVAWNADESRIMGWSESGVVWVWDADNGAELLQMYHPAGVIGALWNADSSRILTWSRDGVVRVWSTDRGEVVLSLRHEGDWTYFVAGAAWSPDESLILTWSDDGAARLWDARMTGEADIGDELITLLHAEDYVYDAVWGPDGSIMTWSNADIKCYQWWCLHEIRIWPADSLIPTYCTITANTGVNLRAGPGTDYEVRAGLAAGESAGVTGQATGADGFVWWQLVDGTWVRADVVTPDGDCARAPAVESP